MKIIFETKKLISFLLIIGMIIPSLLLLPAHKAQAQSSGWFYYYVDGLGETRTSIDYSVLASCEIAREQAGTSIGSCTTSDPPELSPDDSGTSGQGGAGAPKVGSTAAEALTNKGCVQFLGAQFSKLFTKKVAAKVEDTTKENTEAANAVPVFSVSVNDKLNKIKDDTTATKQSTGYLMKKGGCLDSIAKIIIKNMIGYITASLITWINTGFEGKPFYLENPDGFFKNIAKNQFLEFGNSIKDPALFPFGRNFIAGAALAFNRKFERNAQYSLNTLIAKTHPGKTGVDFSSDFRIGGWDAYLGMTSPQNNPIGFNIVAANELSVRLEGTAVSKANQVKETLQQAGGFLGDERCVDPNQGSVRITHEEDARARRGESDSGGIPYRICKRFEYVTPGKLIGDKLTGAANSPEKRLEIADDLNAALAALADALIAKGITTLTNEGLKALSGPGNTPSAWNAGVYGDASTTYGSGTQFPNFYLAPGSWISKHPGFDLKTDLTQAVVDEQRTYKDKLGLYTEALHEVTKWVRQLDYCIPGPNPDWESTSREILDGSGKTNPKKFWWDTDAGQLVSSITGTGGQIFAAIGNNKKDKEDRQAAAIAVEKILDVGIGHAQDQMRDQSGVEALLGNVFQAYSGKINEIYFSGPLWPRSGTAKNFMPEVTTEARAEFEKVVGYEKIAENNIKEIAFRKSIVTRIESLKQKIDNFNNQVNPNNQANPEDQLVIAEFARLSAYFVDGDDIAEIVNLYEEIKDKTTYVKNDLLTGTYGCEKFLGDLWQTDPLAYSTYVRRQPYSFPIDHLYGPVNSNGGPYHIPWSPSYVGRGSFDPNEGFLYFSYYYNNPSASNNDPCAESLKFEQDSGSAANTCLSLPNSGDTSSGCSAPNGSGETSDVPINPPPSNNCGVITRGLEKSFNVY